jgi:predicted nucleotidyltransferase
VKARDRRQLAEVVALIRDVLGSDAVAAYAHGSTATDRLQPRSDIDVLVVARRQPSAATRRRLTAGLLEISGGLPPDPNRPVELTVVVQAEIRPWHYPPRMAYQYGEWLRSDYLSGSAPGPRAEPDLAVLVSMARAGGVALFGPPPSVVLDAVPEDDLRRSIVAGIPGLIRNLPTDTRNVLLTLARIWYTLATGQVGAKDEAGTWAGERLPAPARATLARAIAMYLGEVPEVAWNRDLPAAKALAEQLLSRIDELRAAAPATGPV